MDAEDLETLAKSDPDRSTRPTAAAGAATARASRSCRRPPTSPPSKGSKGLTIGRLATELGMSKSGLFAHFGSKEELQLATIDAARRRFVDHVIRPSRALPRGRARLEALLADWLAYFRSEIFRGGCFFNTVKAEFDSRPDTAVRAVIAEDVRQFLGFLDARGPQDAGGRRPRPGASTPSSSRSSSTRSAAAANHQFQFMRTPRSSTARPRRCRAPARRARAALDLVDAQ